MRCVDCGRETARNEGRGLCAACRSRHAYHGTLIDFERPSRTAEELVEEWLMLREEGHSRAQAAERLGMKRSTFDTAMLRAMRRGLLTRRQAYPLEIPPRYQWRVA